MFIAWATQLGWSWVGALGVPGVNRSLLTPSTFVAHWLAMAFGHGATILSLTRGIAMLLTVTGVAYLLWRAPRFGTVRACGYALALVVALGPIVLPWYALWALVVLAAAGDARDRLYAVIATMRLPARAAAVGVDDARPHADDRRRAADGRGRRDLVRTGAARESNANGRSSSTSTEELGVAGAFHGTTSRLGERTRGLLPHAGARLAPP